MSVINTNVMSLSTQLNLSRSQSALGTAIERLSSGMRINSAKDDAAGQAIANRFTSNIKGLAQARRNSMDGISIAQTTEGALNEINNNLQRVRELSVQAANGSNSSSDLGSIQSEIQQRLDEIDRISAQTQFNGKKVLAEDNALKLQVGAFDNEQITINLKQTDVSTLGLTGFRVNDIRGAGRGVDNTILAAAPTAVVAGDLPTLTGVAGATTVKLEGFDATQFGLPSSTITIDAANIYEDTTDGIYAKVTFTAPTDPKELATFTDANLIAGDYYVKINPANAAADGTLTTQANIDLSKLNVNFSSLVVNGATMNAPDIARTTTPLARVDAALKEVDTLRGELGAVQNRLDSTINNLGTAVNNLSSSRSRIEDADYAVEVSNMSRAQILQQAGTSVLAQANQVPQTVLSLLR